MRVAYPRKGITPENVTIPMLEITREIIPEFEKIVFDKWFSVGSLLEDGIENYYGYLTNDYEK